MPRCGFHRILLLLALSRERCAACSRLYRNTDSPNRSMRRSSVATIHTSDCVGRASEALRGLPVEGAGKVVSCTQPPWCPYACPHAHAASPCLTVSSFVGVCDVVPPRHSSVMVCVGGTDCDAATLQELWRARWRGPLSAQDLSFLLVCS